MAQNSEVLRIFKQCIQDDFAIPVAAMNSLINVIRISKATTLMELGNELSEAVHCLKECTIEDLGGKSNIPLISGCDLFMKYVTKAFELQQSKEFSHCKNEILKRGERYATMSIASRKRIANLGHNFIEDGFTVLVHGDSRVVACLLMRAAERNSSNDDHYASTSHTDPLGEYINLGLEKQFNLIITEGSPERKGHQAAKKYIEAGIPTRVIPDTAVATLFEDIDLCLMGAEGVMENGGIVNKVGTYQIAILAKAFKKPFYVAVESYKFARMYPLSQRDLHQWGSGSSHHHSSGSKAHSKTPDTATLINNKNLNNTLTSSGLRSAAVPVTHTHSSGNSDDQTKSLLSSGSHSRESEEFDTPKVDFTPSEYITLLFTDLGVLTPAAVSDELIRLYQ